MKRNCWFLSLLVVALFIARAAKQPGRVSNDHVIESYSKLPLLFEANAGQTDDNVKFVARGTAQTVYLTSSELILSLHSPNDSQAKSDNRLRNGSTAATSLPAPLPEVRQHTLRMKFIGADPNAELVGLDESGGTSNYFIGNDPAKWRTNVPTYRKVVQRNVYPGVDVAYYGNGTRLEYDIMLAPGANPDVIQSRFDGAETLELDAQGNLIISTAAGKIVQAVPQFYQEIDGTRKAISGRYVFRGERTVAFEVDSYDRNHQLVIDPVLDYATSVGGTNFDVGVGIAVDSQGNAYIVGHTGSIDFPTQNPAQASLNNSPDIFVTKLNATGTAAIYSTYLGGSAATFEDAGGIALDSSGNAYVTGRTDSSDFPTTIGAFSTALHASPPGTTPIDAFVTKLNATGNALVYSTYLGGSRDDYGAGIAVDSTGNAYVAGSTASLDFPTTNAFQAIQGGGGWFDAFITKLNASGSALVYSSYLGGADTDQAFGIAVDSAGNAYVTGYTQSINFPTANAFQSSLAVDVTGRGSDAFVTKFSASGNALVYSTYLGGSRQNLAGGDGGDFGFAIAVDASGSAYVTGDTTSINFPLVNPMQSMLNGQGTPNGIADAFVTKFNAGGSALYSTYLGGRGLGYGIAVDGAENAYVTGPLVDFPLVNAALNTGLGFLAKLNAAGSAFVYSTYLGGSNSPRAVAVDSASNAYVTGTATSLNTAVIGPGGGTDAFVLKISNQIALSPQTASLTTGETHTLSATVKTSNGILLPGVLVDFIVTGVNPFVGNGATNAAGVASFSYVGATVGMDTIRATGTIGGISVTSNSVSVNWTAPPTGTISVTTNLSAATFTISGPSIYGASGTSFTQTNAPTGTYTIAYGAVVGYTTPASETRTLSTGSTISFVGNYAILAPLCRAPTSLFADSTQAFALLEETLANKHLDQGKISTDVQIRNFLRVWLGVVEVTRGVPNGTFTLPTIAANLAAGSGGLAAKANLLPPCQTNLNPISACRTPGAADWVASFCDPGTIKLTFGMTLQSASVTLVDLFLPGSPPATLIGVSAELETLPDFRRASDCLLLNRGSLSTRLACVIRSLRNLAGDTSQIRAMRVILNRFGISLTLQELLTRLVGISSDMLQVTADLILLEIQTIPAGTPGKLSVTITGN